MDGSVGTAAAPVRAARRAAHTLTHIHFYICPEPRAAEELKSAVYGDEP